MKIISFTAENVKRLVVAHIEPKGNLVQITGKNGQGKTSILDSIWWTLSGAEHIQSSPIRSGQNEAKIRLVLKGESRELIVTRKFKRKPGEEGAPTNDYTTSITVETVDGARFGSPQKMLDELLGELAFDPLAFARMRPREQFDALRKFVPNLDFEALDKANTADEERRREIHRDAKQARAIADSIKVPDGTQDEPIDDVAMLTQIETAIQHNNDVTNRANNRNTVALSIDNDRRQAADCDEWLAKDIAKIDADLAKNEKESREEIERLLKKIQASQEAAAVERKLKGEHWSQEKRLRTAEADAKQARLDAAEPLPDLIDIADLRTKIAAARAINENVKNRKEKIRQELLATEHERASEEITNAIKARAEQKKNAIETSNLPVAGLGLGDGHITFNSVPFDQASDAEQLKVSVAIAAAMNPKLRVIRIRDGSLLDDEAMQRLDELAQQMDMQVWIERVDSSGKIGFVLEEGHVKQAAPTAETAAA